MDKLRSRKAEVGEQLDRSRFASRFEAPATADPGSRGTTATIGEPLLEGGQPGERPRARPAAGTPTGPGTASPPTRRGREDASYTNRLLKAKQRVWEDREKEKDKRDPRAGP